MGLTLNFRNILDLYGFSVGDKFQAGTLSLNENANIFIDSIDLNKNGMIDRDEYKKMLEAAGFPDYIADQIFDGTSSKTSTAFDADNDDCLSEAEFVALLQDFDDGDNKLDFSETLAFHNKFSTNNIDTSTTFSNYKKLLDLATTALNSYDTDFVTTGRTTINEITNSLKNWGINDGGATGANIVNLFDKNNDNEIDIEEYLSKYNEWDAAGDNDGVVDFQDGEGAEYLGLLPDIFKTPVDSIEQMAQQFILTIDRYNDLELQEDEYKGFVTQVYGLPESMAEELINKYAGGDGSVDFNDLVSAYRGFDSDADGALSYEEMIAFQNSLTAIDIDTSLISETQYNGLYNTAMSVVKSMDENLDGEVSVDEYRAILSKMYEGSGVEPPEFSAENFVRMFDMDKNGTVNVIEAMNKYAEYDTNKDGVVLNSESSDLVAKLQDETLWNSVNSEIIEKADKDNNAKLTLAEFSDYLKENLMPEYIADDAFTLFDRNKDNQLSRLELMEAFSRYDNNVENLSYIENLEGVGYSLYAGDADNKLDTDEMLKFYEDLGAVDYGVNYNPDHSQINQYEPIKASVEDFIEKNDFDKNGVIDANEYKNYLKEQGLPEYLADNAVNNAIVNFDLNNDDSLDFIEWVQINLDYDKNSNGQLELNEVLSMHSDLSGVVLNTNETNIDQYTNLLDAANAAIRKYDLNSDGLLNVSELESYMDQYDLPAVLAQDMLNTYNVSNNADNELDVIELLKAYADTDVNNNGQLEFNEEFSLYDAMTAGNLGINAGNAVQYEKINETVGDLVELYDLDANKKLDINEIKEFFKNEGMTEDAVNLALANYDVNGADSSLDVLEWMKMYFDFDADKDGILNNQEKLAMFDTLAGTGLNPNDSNETQLLNIEQNIDALIQQFDVDGDKKLSANEYKEKMKELGLPDYIANQAVVNYDQDSDGNLDKLELMSAKVAFDANNNGVLEFNEEMAMYSQISGANLNPTTEEIAQYSKLYNQAKVLFSQKDDITDKILTADELKEYFTDLQLPEYMAQEAINMFDLNGDGGLDLYEWIKPQLAYDVNKSGILEFNEQMAMNGIIADPDVILDPNTMNVNQVKGLYNYSLNYVNYVDTDDDKKISKTEYFAYLKTTGLSESVAMDIVAHQDLNNDNAVDIMEWLSTALTLDGNANGTIDFNELMNLYQNATGITLNTTEENKNQHESLYQYANKYVDYVDTNNDGVMSKDEYNAYLKTTGMSDVLGNRLLDTYNLNADNGIDSLELMDALIDFDANENGVFDFSEQLNYYDNALPALDLGANAGNADQYSKLHTYANNYVNYVDTDKDGAMSEVEYQNYLKSVGMTEELGSSLINEYDSNTDGRIDSLELMDALIDFDTNGNGAFDIDEQLNYFDKALPTLELNANASNAAQYNNLFEYAKKYVDYVDTNNDGVMSKDEYNSYLKTTGMSDVLGNSLVDAYNLNADNGIDVLEFMDALIDYDTNENGVFDFNEIIDYYDNALPSLTLNASAGNTDQYSKLHTYANNYVNYVDTDKDGAMSEVEYQNYLKSIGMTKELGSSLINEYDSNSDGRIDSLELMDALIDFDTNGNGVFDSHEQLNYFDKALPTLSLNADAGNAAQYNKLNTYANKYVNYVDTDKDGAMSEVEYQNYLKSVGMTEELGTSLINEYDSNSDGRIDSLEFMDALIDFDTNGNGAFDIDEQLNYYDKALPTLELNANAGNAAQYNNLFTYANKYVNYVDTDKDGAMSEVEYQNYLKTIGMTKELGASLINKYDSNSDGRIDSLEFMDALIDLDTNGNGVFDSDEQLNYYDKALPSLELNADAGNAAQYNKLFTYANNYVNYVDTNKDGAMSEVEYQNYLKTIGLTKELGSSLINAYDRNGDGRIDSLELMDALIDYDTNGNGVFDFNETLNYYDTVMPAINLNASIDNEIQLKNVYNSFSNLVINRDLNNDRKLQANEFELSLISSGFADANTMATNAVSIYDLNNDGGVDSFEWMEAALRFDTNQNGILDGEEITNFYNSIK